MGRIFMAVGQTSLPTDSLALHLATGAILAAQEINLVLDLVVQMLRSRNYELFPVPQDLSLVQTTDWINRRARPGDVALEICADGTDRSMCGATVFYIANNYQRKTHAEQLLQAYLRRVPQMLSRGAKPDIQTELGQLGFCRQVVVPALQLTVGSVIDLDDRRLIQTQRQEVALGIAEGLAAWSRGVAADRAAQPNLPLNLPPIDLNVNGASLDEKGALIEGNAYVPIDLIDQLNINQLNINQLNINQLGIAPISEIAIRRVAYKNVVFVRAIDLRNYNISVRFDASNPTPTLMLRSFLPIAADQFDRIMGQGYASEVQMMVFLKSYYADGLTRFPDLPKLYREEASIEGVNHDIAFAQMCVETDFLRFSNLIKPEQHNFAGLGGLSGVSSGKENFVGASFPSPRIGIRAQIQHLKAYASTAPFVQAIVDPRFSSIRRGIAPTIHQLSGRWAADSHYHDKILSVLRRLYESAGFF